MSKYHVKSNGDTGGCTASEGKCPFTVEGAEHFLSIKEAHAYAEDVIAKIEGGSFAQAGFSRELVGDALHNPLPESDNTGEITFFNGSKVHLSNLWKAVNESPEIAAEVTAAIEASAYPDWSWEYGDPEYTEGIFGERREFEGLSALSLYHFEIGGKSVWAVTHGMSGADERNTNEWAFGLEQTRNATYFGNEEDAQNYWNKLEQAVREEYPELPY